MNKEHWKSPSFNQFPRGGQRTARWFGASAYAVIALSSPLAQAQVVPPSEATVDKNSANQASSQDDEIVVFARKRKENVLDIPIAISVISKAVVEDGNLDDLREFVDLVPNATFSNDSDTSSEISIRGSGRSIADEDQSVGTYRDGVYVGGLIVTTANFYDIANVEILRGPQAGLYGRNAVGGAINVISQRPDKDFGGYVDAQIGSKSRQEFRAALNVPIVDEKWYLRLAGLRINQNRGFDYVVNQDQYVDAQEINSLRLRSLFTPTDKLELLTTFEYLKSEGGGPLAVVAPDAASGFLDQDGTVPIPGTRPEDTDNQFRNLPQIRELKQIQAIQEVNITTGAGTLTGLVSYRSGDFFSSRDEDLTVFDVSDIDYDTSQDSFFAELRFTSRDFGGLRLVGGTTYLNEDMKINFNNRIGGAFAGALGGASIAELFSTGIVTPAWSAVLGIPVGTPISLLGLTPGATGWNGFLGDTFPSEFINNQKLKSISFFTEANYQLSPKVEIWGNVRYTSDDKSIDFAQTFGIPSRCPVACNQFFGLLFNGLQPELSGTGQKSFKRLSPGGGINYRVTEDVRLYAKAVTGFKAGGFNSISASPERLSFDEETTISYEIGAKASLFDRRLTLNAAAFIQKRNNALVTILDPELPINSLGVNAGEIKNKGLELEFSAKPISGFQLQGAFGYLDAKFKEFDIDGTDFSGNYVPRNFRYSLSMIATYTYPISEKASMFVYTSYKNAWKGFTDIDNVERMSNPEVVDVRLGLKGNSWKLVGYIDNLFDNRYTSSEFRPVINGGRHFGIFAPGRTFGVQGALDF